MIRIPDAAEVCKAPHLSAIYIPPSCSAPNDTVERKWRLVVDTDDMPLVTIVPPAVPPRFVRALGEERIILALASSMVKDDTASDLRRACDPFLFDIAYSIRAGMRLHRLPTLPYLESLAPVIGDHLQRFYPPRPRRRERRGLDPAKLSRVLALIEEKLEVPLGIEELAAAVHLSSFHFGRMFCRSLGISPHAYITKRRIEKAKRLLATSDLPLAEIAKVVGYRNQAHFTRVFHQVAATTPRRYRLAHRRSAEDDIVSA